MAAPMFANAHYDLGASRRHGNETKRVIETIIACLESNQQAQPREKNV